MTIMSKAAVLVGREQIEIREFPLPEIGEDEGIVKVEASGICGFDAEAYRYGGNGLFQLPCIMGHEIVGRVYKIGEKAAERWGIKEGDRIVIEEYIPCGQCKLCIKGNYQMCAKERYGAMSIDHPKTALWGGYSEYMYLHPRSIIHKVSESTPTGLLELFIPISNGLHWVQDVGNTKNGETVIIQGPGPMGLGCVVGAKEAGASKIIVTGLERDEARLNLAKELGADHVLYADKVDLVEEISKLTDGEMGDTVINASSSPQSLALAVQLAANYGYIVHAGSDHRLTDQLMSRLITTKVLTVRGVLGRPFEAVDAALRIIESGKYPLEKMVTHTFTIDEADQALKTAAYGLDGAIHVGITSEKH